MKYTLVYNDIDFVLRYIVACMLGLVGQYTDCIFLLMASCAFLIRGLIPRGVKVDEV